MRTKAFVVFEVLLTTQVIAGGGLLTDTRKFGFVVVQE
ncbi:hypothetical protein MLPF_1835 [Mycobacterium lepromatosis]|nr:hypothetical protein MLPF_1835 [Mycobacterium lepromatosis]